MTECQSPSENDQTTKEIILLGRLLRVLKITELQSQAEEASFILLTKEILQLGKRHTSNILVMEQTIIFMMILEIHTYCI